MQCNGELLPPTIVNSSEKLRFLHYLKRNISRTNPSPSYRRTGQGISLDACLHLHRETGNPYTQSMTSPNKDPEM